MPNQREGGPESPQSRFEREVVEPTKRAMEEALSQSTSKEDAEQRIKDALPKDRSFSDPTIRYSETYAENRKIRRFHAIVLTHDDKNNPVKIEAVFIG